MAMTTMEDLPTEMRELLYKELDRVTLRKVRLVNPIMQNEVDSLTDYITGINITTNDLSQEFLQPIVRMRVKYAKFQSPEYDQGLVYGVAREEPMDLDWVQVFRFPDLVKSLEFGGNWSSDWDFGTSGLMDLQLIPKAILECMYLEKLSLKNLKVYGKCSNTDLFNEFIRVMADLQSLELSFNESSDAPGEALAVPLISKILNLYHSSFLTSLSLSLVVQRYQIPEGYDGGCFLLNSLAAGAVKLVARHWSTLKELNLEGVDGCESERVDSIGPHVLKNLKKIESLKVLTVFGNNKFNMSSELMNILIDLIKQQNNLEVFGTSRISQQTLSHVIRNNFSSLKSLDVGHYNFDEVVYDMNIFSPCRDLESLRVVNDGPSFKIVNLGALSPKITSLSLSKFDIPSIEQLLQCSFRFNLISLDFDFVGFYTGPRLDIAIYSFIRNNYGSLDNLKVKVERYRGNNTELDSIWDVEFRNLSDIFNRYFNHYSVIQRQVEDDQQNRYDFSDISILENQGLELITELCEFKVCGIITSA